MKRGLAIAVVLAAMAQPLTAAHAKHVPRAVEVVVDKLAFGTVPADLRVGDTVIWVNRDLFRHSATATGHFDVDLQVGARRPMLLTKAGTYAFKCKYHPGMKGVLKVRG